MEHLSHLKASANEIPDDFFVRATGRYYTHREVASHLNQALLKAANGLFQDGQILKVIDPFAGDGRLLRWLLEEWNQQGLPKVRWHLELWDIDPQGIAQANLWLQSIANSGFEISFNCRVGDSFLLASQCDEQFDIVITNPPWELLKPDSRELKRLNSDVRNVYIEKMRDYDNFLGEYFPTSQPGKKFAGWGTNLSRVGLDVCYRICARRSLVGIVMPASFLADDQSLRLRQQMLCENNLFDVAYFPAEAKLFGSADVAASTLLFEIGRKNGVTPHLTRYDQQLNLSDSQQIKISHAFLEANGFVLPVSVGANAFALLQKLSTTFPSWESIEGSSNTSLWAGREVDETGSKNWLQPNSPGPLFIKGRMVDRFSVRESPILHAEKPNWNIPKSINQERIAWRDVSRPNQKRRVIATIIPSGWVAGNSLGVAYFRDGNPVATRCLLGIMSSVVFEFQLRSHLATGHISLSSLRKTRVPGRKILESYFDLYEAVESALSGNDNAENKIEALVAKDVYGLSRDELDLILNAFPKINIQERNAILNEYDKLIISENREKSKVIDYSKGVHFKSKHTNMQEGDMLTTGIPNHHTAKLSELDMRMVKAVPPGGNWKNIPESIPSKRLDQIRISFKQGKGSRSTYYGRLLPNMPSYTINTYFNRPGNGCHMHYDQNRVLSQREAARLQSFTDDFIFVGPQGSVNTQIGNAVPPLLAFQIAKSLGEPGYFVDLFCGAGGLGLGFKWAGWKPVLANDIEPRFLETYTKNVHENTVVGSIADPAVFKELVSQATDFKKNAIGTPFWILGGPPCQGFSTAGHRRTMEDKRNQLFWEYKKFLEHIKPDGFVFENVTGLLNMQAGRVFEQVKEAFRTVMPSLNGWLLAADEYAIPQRRKRVILIGNADENFVPEPPPRLTSCKNTPELFCELKNAVSVEEAISDLPSLESGQNGSSLDYISLPRTAYQAFVRGCLTADQYLERIRSDKRIYKGSDTASN